MLHPVCAHCIQTPFFVSLQMAQLSMVEVENTLALCVCSVVDGMCDDEE